MYHGEMEDWLNGNCSKMEIVGKCLKFLINKDLFFIKKILYRIFSKLIYCYNIIFLYKIWKIIRNIFINILSHERKMLCDEDGLIETIQCG